MMAARPGWHPRARLFATRSPVLLQNSRSRSRKDLSISSVVRVERRWVTGRRRCVIQASKSSSRRACGTRDRRARRARGSYPVSDSVLQLGFREDLTMWKGATVAAAFLLFGACAQDKEQTKAQTEEFAKAAGEAAAQIAQQDDARCQSYGKPGSAAYIDCRTSLKSDRAEMKK